MAWILGPIALIVCLGYAGLQFFAGYLGIAAWAGSGWAVAAIFFAFFLRLTFPITIGAFYGAMAVWDWPWYWALLFALPGLALVVPGVIASVLDALFRVLRYRR